MKLKLPTIIFGAALSVVALGSQASAANLNVSNKMTGSATIGGIGTFSVSASGSTAGIEATDYVEFDYYNIGVPSFLGGSNVVYNGQNIGKVSVRANHHSSKTQNKDVDDSVTPYYSDGKIRVTFNENITKFDSLDFTISGQNGADAMDVDRAYTLDSWISLNSQRLAVKTTNIAAVRPVDLTQTCLRMGGIYFDVEGRQNSFNFHLDNAGEAPFKAGDKVKIIIPESSPIRFKSYAGSEPKMTHHFNFISVDTPKNVHGVYFTRTTPNPKVRISAIVGNEMNIEILEDFPAKDGVYYTGINNIFEVLRYENITNNIMPINI